MRKLLFTRESECIQPLRKLVEKQSHKTLVVWALDCSLRFLDIYEKYYPNETRLQELIQIAKSWAKGDIKMPIVKKAILAVHHVASEADIPQAQAAARSIAHAAASIHVETHALGVVFYGLTALVYENKPEDIECYAEEQCQWFYDKLVYWEENIHHLNTTWAPFLMDETRPNKEALLRIRLENKE